jgi:hypothetical protein
VVIEMEHEKKKIFLTPVETDVLYALTTGDDSRVRLHTRSSVCVALHDGLAPGPPIIPPELDPDGLKPMLVFVVNWALGMNKDMTNQVLKRWTAQTLDYLASKRVDPSLN